MLVSLYHPLIFQLKTLNILFEHVRSPTHFRSPPLYFCLVMFGPCLNFTQLRPIFQVLSPGTQISRWVVWTPNYAVDVAASWPSPRGSMRQRWISETVDVARNLHAYNKKQRRMYIPTIICIRFYVYIFIYRDREKYILDKFQKWLQHMTNASLWMRLHSEHYLLPAHLHWWISLDFNDGLVFICGNIHRTTTNGSWSHGHCLLLPLTGKKAENIRKQVEQNPGGPTKIPGRLNMSQMCVRHTPTVECKTCTT